ncbi:MAG: MBL fold metallo-hydrolase [Candidatus Hodarchaeota archaeon]
MVTKRNSEIVFLGTGAPTTLPAFFCTCSTCEEARENPDLRRTRAALALLGEENTIIDTGPDIEHQLERESIRTVENIFITHWHYDHFAGLPGLFEPVSISKWGRIQFYGTIDIIDIFERKFAFIKDWFDLHTIKPGDRIQLKDATWEVVKTTHTEHSVGFVVDAATKFAYLLDSAVPPPETISRLRSTDLLITEATLDSLDADWTHFDVEDAVNFWRETGVAKCILTHLAGHSWKEGQLIPGMTPEERKEYERKHPGLTFAHDGMRVTL